MFSALVKVGVAVVMILFGCTLEIARSQPGYIGQRWDNGIGHSSWDLAIDAKERQQMQSLWEIIGQDLKTEQNQLAGTYVKGGYSAGYFLRWSVGKGFILIPYFDQNLITDFSYGKVDVFDSSRIVFTPEKELKGGRSVAKTPREWTAIGNYFVPVEMLKDFGQFQAGLGTYNEFNGQCCEFWPNFLCRKIDAQPSARSYPVPVRFAHFMKRPIEGTITFVGGKLRVKNWGYQGELYGQWMETAVLIPVKVDLGRDRRVKKNMLLRLAGEPDSGQYLQIIRVGSRTSMGYVVRDVSFGGKEIYRDSSNDQEKPLSPIRVGIKVTTRPMIY
jgi:hypothetical protein